MNLKRIVSEMVESHPDWDLFTKVRWIYLETCKIFSYDWRYICSDDKRADEIYQFRLDSENVTQFEIICSTWAYLFSDLLKFIGVKSEILMPDPPHCFVKFTIGEGVFLADSTTIGHDLSRVKLGVSTVGFNNVSGIYSQTFQQQLDKTDELIGFKQLLYTDRALLHLIKDLKEDGYDKNQSVFSFSFEQLNYKMGLIQILINDTNKIRRFYDTFSYFSYLTHKLFTDSEIGKLLVEPYYNLELGKVVDLISYDVYDENRRFYVIEDDNGKYKLEQTTSEHIEYYLNNYQGQHPHLFRN